MKKTCDCYHTITKTQYCYDPLKFNYMKREIEVGICYGTKECEECNCGGNENKCDFYPEVRKRVKKINTEKDKLINSIVSYIEKDENWNRLKNCWLVDGRSEELRKLIEEAVYSYSDT